MIAGFIASIRRRVTVAEGFVTLTVAMVLLVPAQTFRYMLPLAPFLVFYFFNGVDAIARLARGAEFGAAFRVSTACVIGLLAIDHIQYIASMYTGTPPWLRDYAEVKGETDWMRLHLTREGPIATSNPGLIYLTTGRKAMALTNLRRNWLELQRAGVPYGATLHMTAPPAILDFPMLYESPHLKLWVIEIPAAVRTPLTESASDR
jgi:hypothetical protein